MRIFLFLSLILSVQRTTIRRHVTNTIGSIHMDNSLCPFILRSRSIVCLSGAVTDARIDLPIKSRCLVSRVGVRPSSQFLQFSIQVRTWMLALIIPFTDLCMLKGVKSLLLTLLYGTSVRSVPKNTLLIACVSNRWLLFKT